MSFSGKLTGLTMAVMSLYQLPLAVPKGLADQPTLSHVATRADEIKKLAKPDAGHYSPVTPAGIPPSELTLLEDKLGELETQLLSVQQQPLRQFLKDPVSSRGRVEVHLIIEGIDATPEKIELKWDNQSVTTVEYTHLRQAALSKGGAEKLIALDTHPGVHTLGIHYTHKTSLKDHTLYVATIPIQKKNTITVLLLKPKLLNKGLELVHEVWEGPFTEEKDRWLKLWHQNAIFHYQLGQFQEAAGLLLICLESQGVPSKRAELLLWLAKTYLGWGLEGQAILTLQQLIQQSPSTDRILPEAWYYLQKAQYRQGRFEAVTSAYTRTDRRFAPVALPEMHYIAGQSFLRQKDYPKAIATLNQIPKASRYYPYALYARGLAYYVGLGDTYAAQQAFKKLIDLDPQDISKDNSKDAAQVARLIEKGLVTLGLMLIEQDRYQEAISALGMLSTRSRFFDQALFGIGWSYMKLEEYVKAIVAFGDLIEKFPESPYAYEARLMVGHSYSKLKAYTKAVDSYRKSLEASSRRVTLLTQQTETLLRKGINLNEINQSPRLEIQDNSDKIREAVERYEELARLSSIDWVQPFGNDLQVRLKELGHRLSMTLQELTLQALQRQRERLEDLSIQAGIGIAKNLLLEKTEFGGEDLVLE